jgi:choline dehydrogenase-like flavoprotein
MEVLRADIAIIGSGPGGGTLFGAVAASGADVLLVERGGFIPQEPENWDVRAVFDSARYRAHDYWLDAGGRRFRPGIYYNVGGSSKMWGACLTRFRAEDFEALQLHDGVSPAWPFTYDALAPYYTDAEALYGVHGTVGEDPTAPAQDELPLPRVAHEPVVARIVESMSAQGLHPYVLPLGIDRHEGGSCVRCRTCDGFPCRVGAKNDADMQCVRPAMKQANARVALETRVERLITNAHGDAVIAAEAVRGRERVRIEADKFVVSCGAANSAALLLRSQNAAHPRGLANSSDQVGRNYMQHLYSAIMAVDPRHRTELVYQKTVGLNDYYLPSAERSYGLGNLQALGKLQAGMLTAEKPWVPRAAMTFLAERSTDWWTTTEDLPDPDNRITVEDGGIRLAYRLNNDSARRELTRIAKRILRRAGFPLVFAQPMGLATTSAQCGTVVAGIDPGTSVLDPLCRSHDVGNLFVVDASFFPSSAALNPGLTIAAQALRVADQSDLLGGEHDRSSWRGARPDQTTVRPPSM